MENKKIRYDFKKVLEIAKANKHSYRVKFYSSGSLFGLRYWLGKDGNEYFCSHTFKTSLECHNAARLDLMNCLERHGLLKIEELIIKN